MIYSLLYIVYTIIIWTLVNVGLFDLVRLFGFVFSPISFSFGSKVPEAFQKQKNQLPHTKSDWFSFNDVDDDDDDDAFHFHTTNPSSIILEKYGKSLSCWHICSWLNGFLWHCFSPNMFSSRLPGTCVKFRAEKSHLVATGHYTS